MAIIIGSATTVGGQFSGAVSAQWGINPQVNRLWQLGSWSPYAVRILDVETVNVTTYAGGGPTINLSPATSCSDSTAKFNITISPGSCGGGVAAGITGSFYLMSYNYSKGDAIGYGQESYSGQRWPGGTGNHIKAPTVVIQGTSEGSVNADSGLNAGVNIPSPDATGTQGSVSAGFPGVGQATTTVYGIVNRVGGGDLKNDGKIGQAQANVPHQPLYF